MEAPRGGERGQARVRAPANPCIDMASTRVGLFVSTEARAALSTLVPSSLIGRDVEMERLSGALLRAKGGSGSTWLLLGAGGMGKTRLLRWLEREAVGLGFQVSWGNGLQESIAPFFVFEQVFRRKPGRAQAGEAPSSSGAVSIAEAGAYLLFEDDRPRRFRSALATLGPEQPLLYATRENPMTLKERGVRLPSGATTLWITRMEGENRLSPSNLDGLGESATRYLKEHPGGVVALEGMEYLASQNGFGPILRLVQFLRDLTEESGGHLMVTINPAAFDRKEVSLLESDAEVVRAEGAQGGAPSSDPKGLPPGNEPPSERLLRYLNTLERAAMDAPQLVVVDDLHWTDTASGSAFQFLARNLGDLPVLMVGAAREDEIPSTLDETGSSTIERLDALSREGLLERLPLRGFGPEETRSFAAQVLGAPFVPGDGTDEIRMMIGRTEGNPYFLRELFLQLQQDGALKEERGHLRFLRSTGPAGGLLDSVPPTLRRLVLQRIAHLSKEERAFLDLAAMVGSEFDLLPVSAVGGLSLEEAREMVEGLSRRRRLLEGSLDGTEDRWSFSHPLVWEVTISELQAAARRRSARDFLGWWEEHRPEDVQTLARLAVASEDPVRGRPWVRRAFERAIASLSPESASTYLAWLRDLRRSSPDALDPALLREELQGTGKLIRVGGCHQARKSLQDLLAEGLPKDLQFAARSLLVRATEPHDMAEAQRICEELLAESAAHPDQVPATLQWEARSLDARLREENAKFQESMDRLEPLLSNRPPELDRELLALALCSQAHNFAMVGRQDDAARLAEESLSLAGENELVRSRAFNVLGLIEDFRGNRQKVIEYGERSAESAQRAGSLSQSSLARYNTGVSRLQLGHLDEAERIGRDLLDLGVKFDMPRIRCCGYFLIAQAEAERKQWSSATTWMTRALEEARSTERKDDVYECLASLGDFKERTGDLAGALEALEEIEAAGYFEVPVQRVSSLPALVRVLVRKGDLARAKVEATRSLEAARNFHNPTVQKEMEDVLAHLAELPPGASPSDASSSKPL